jgi:hypothetical protein
MIRFYSKTDQPRTAPLTSPVHCRRFMIYDPLPPAFLTTYHYPPTAGFPASSAGSAYPGGPFEAKNNKRDDFIHSEMVKTDVTLLSSTNPLQNPRRFFAIFIDFCAQIGPFSPQIAPPGPSRTAANLRNPPKILRKYFRKVCPSFLPFRQPQTMGVQPGESAGYPLLAVLRSLIPAFTDLHAHFFETVKL